MANFFDPRPAPDAEPSTPDGVLIEWVIRLPDVDACDGAIIIVLVACVFFFVCESLIGEFSFLFMCYEFF